MWNWIMWELLRKPLKLQIPIWSYTGRIIQWNSKRLCWKDLTVFVWKSNIFLHCLLLKNPKNHVSTKLTVCNFRLNPSWRENRKHLVKNCTNKKTIQQTSTRSCSIFIYCRVCSICATTIRNSTSYICTLSGSNHVLHKSQTKL